LRRRAGFSRIWSASFFLLMNELQIEAGDLPERLFS
jgi:hypothetical protein